MNLHKTICCLFLLFSTISFGQLSNFNLNVVVTNETCTNNGSLTINVSNATAGSTIIYELFLAPNFTNPIAETMNTSFSGLAAGSYRIIATQTKNNDSNKKQEDVIIGNLLEP